MAQTLKHCKYMFSLSLSFQEILAENFLAFSENPEYPGTKILLSETSKNRLSSPPLPSPFLSSVFTGLKYQAQ